MESAAFEWGWDALVACGTIALAAGTFLLALGTSRAARASAADVRAQWRPAMVPGGNVDVEFDLGLGLVLVTVHNIGRGAAYHVDAALGVDGTYWPARDSVPGRQAVENFAVCPPQAELRLCFEYSVDRPSEGEIVIDYTDLNGRPYSTLIELNEINTASVLRMANVELSDNRERIPWKPWTWEPSTRREWLRSKVRRREKTSQP